MNTTTTEPQTGRPLSSLLGLLLLPLFLGILAAPFVYNAMMLYGHDPAVADRFPGFAAFLREASFEKVTNRCVLIAAVLLLVPMVRRAGLSPSIRRDVRWDAKGRRDLEWSLALGCASMTFLYAGSIALGAFEPSARVSWAPGAILGAVASFLAGAAFIGYFEEVFFRGFVFGAIRTKLAFWPSALLASVFFSAIHFVDPRHPGRVDIAAWYEAFLLVPHLFGSFDPSRDGAFAVTLFLMGLTLCVIYQRHGSLWTAIGLHAGWVLVMQAGGHFLNRVYDVHPWWFTSSDFVARGPIAAPVMLAFLVWALAQPARRGQPAA